MLKSKILNTGVVLILLILGILASQPAAAQQEEQIAAQYVIQPGDTLSKIAIRFDVDVNQLSTANSITNPNQLTI